MSAFDRRQHSGIYYTVLMKVWFLWIVILFHYVYDMVPMFIMFSSLLDLYVVLLNVDVIFVGNFRH